MKLGSGQNQKTLHRFVSHTVMGGLDLNLIKVTYTDLGLEGNLH